jgi:phosphatidylglycerol lysyltransferase
MAAQDRMVMIQDTSLPVAGLLLGAQPVWRPQHWAARLMHKASFRGQLARARNKQVRIGRWESERATNHPDLRRCLHEWLQQRRMPPMHFLVEPDTLGQLRDREVFVAERHGLVIGFLIASPVACRQGWLIEQIIRTRAAPNGTTELLLDHAMRHLAAIGADYVTLGLSPLSRRAGLAQTAQTGSVRVLLSGLRAYGQRFYNFEGLDAYKAKFLPEWWEPVYAISRERHISLRTLYAIAGAFGGTSPLLYIGHSMLWAAGQELRAAGQRLRRG